MRVVFHPRVFSEVDAIMRYYEDVAGPQLADDFYDEFRLFVQHASQYPDRYSPREGGLKRKSVSPTISSSAFLMITSESLLSVITQGDRTTEQNENNAQQAHPPNPFRHSGCFRTPTTGLLWQVMRDVRR